MLPKATAIVRSVDNKKNGRVAQSQRLDTEVEKKQTRARVKAELLRRGECYSTRHDGFGRLQPPISFKVGHIPWFSRWTPCISVRLHGGVQ